MREAILTSLLAVSVLVPAAPSHAAEKLGYNRDIRPILSDKCFHCHGPDKNKRDSGLRLDVREDAIADRDGFHAIMPGKPDESEIIARISTTDADDHMPPAKAKLESLTAAEVAMLKRWIAEGAEYEKHWAFIPLKPETVRSAQSSVLSKSADPKLSTEHWALRTQPVDAAVSVSLAQRGLKLQPEADRDTIIRRVSFDITGLPPSPQEVADFEKDTAPGAYERVVDRLLASPRFGERMAVDWLDIARYADSYGFQVDREREEIGRAHV